MKNSRKFIVLISAVWMLILFYQNVQAQQNLAREAYAIIEDACLICHGENGSFSDDLLIEYTALIEDGSVVPEDPDASVFYQRLIETDIAKRMPLGQPPLDPAAIETIHQWIAAGAPDWDAIPKPKPSFITTDTMLETIENHVNSLAPRDKSFARYFTLTHLYNAGETTEALNAYRRALSKLINSLSWGRKVVKPQPIDAEQTLFYIDLRDYEWDVRNDAWTQIEQTYPYKMTFDAPTQAHLSEKLTTLQQEMNCEVPFINVDWFLATASLPPLYHDILALPETDRELEAALEVFVAENLLNAPGKRVWRAGFNNSRVSRHNRVVERHISRYGAYWKSYDFAGSAESQNIFTHPLDFTHDGGEIIFNLPNGLQAYYLADGDGNRLNEAPISIVSNPAVGDPTVRNGLSCIGCHTKGMQTFEDEVRAVVEQIENPPFNKERALDLYVEKTVMDGLIEEDTQRYRDALEAAGGVFGGIEPVQRLHEAFQAPLSAAHAAAAVGLETDVFLEKISKSPTLQNLLGTLVLENGTVKRDAWTSDFHDVISGINSPDTVPPPVVERPEIIPGAGVHIPDSNLRAAIGEALGKDAGEVITVEDMAALNGIKAVDKDIRDLTGIEHAINASWFTFETNQIADLSPLARLKSLYKLRLGHNHISDLAPLSGLINLTYLSLYNNPEIKELSPLTSLKNLQYISLVNSTKISDISSLAELVNLKHIQIWGSPISDLSPLAGLTHLEILDICGADKPNISVLKELTGLKEVYLVSNGISDLQPLAELTGLTRLNLDDNKISDVSPLANLTNLKWLKLTNNPIADFSPLVELSQNTNIIAGSVNIPDRDLRAAIAETLGKSDTAIVPITLQEMGTLTTLRASNKDIKDLTGLEYAINLENFFVSMTEAEAIESTLSDLSPLAGLTKLRRLSIPGKMISDLSPLSGLVNLAELQLFVTNVSNLSPLAGLTNLKSLLFNHAPVSDLSPIAELTGLESLRFFYAESPSREGLNPSLEPLKGLVGLKILSAARSRITDISPLSGLVNLEELELFGNQLISDVSPLASMHKLRRLNLHRNNITDVSSLASLRSLVWVDLAFNNISDISPMEGLPKDPNVIWYENPGFPVGGPKIEGPWLWSMVPGPELDNDTDFLAQASSGAVTELQIASYGAVEGTAVGESVWTAHNISPTGGNNISEMTNALGWTTGEETVGYILYGSVKLNSSREQQTEIFVGADDGVKVWLNGEFIHKKFGGGWDPFANNYQNNIPVTLNKGVNVLLVAIDNRWGNWSGFFGFEPETEYTVLPPRIIADPNLHAAIAEALGKENIDTDPITREEMATLTQLRASNRDIKDLTGLEFAINLEEMWIGHNPVSDLSPLAGLKNFIGLHAWETRISDLFPLSGLTKLRWLDFGRTPTDENRNLIGRLDLTPLAGITSLKKLTFYACGVQDISPLAGLTELTELRPAGNPISDLSPLAKLINLEYIDFHGGNIANLSPLAGLNNLRHLDFRSNSISDVSPLAGLTNLQTLTLNDNQITDISPLQHLPVFPDIIWVGNPGTPNGGPKIEGPWLWVKFPAEHLDTDWLAEASGGVVTEQQIATYGASEGKSVGNSLWRSAKIDQNKGNINRMLESLGDDGGSGVVYGSIILVSPLNQQTNMLVGGKKIKVWLNSDLVQTHGIDSRGWPYNYGRFFPVTLKQGANVLLVAVQNDGGSWSGFFGFEEGTEYTVVPPDVRLTFSASETTLLSGDTFTLNLTAENITDLAGWQTDIAFDPNVLEAVEVTEGDFLKSEGSATFFQGGTIDNMEGKIKGMFAARQSEGGVSGTGTLLSVTFMAKAGGETQITLENFEFGASDGTIIPTVPPNITITVGEYPAWDVNQDGRGSILDLILVAQDFGSGAPANLRTDVNRDGVINVQDLIIVSQHIGESTDSAAPTILAVDSEELTPAMVQTWIDQAQAVNDGSLAFQQGIENLQKLLASLLPEKTALLANYPNPFNPETWIPYHLAKPADVTLTIYAANGAIVRTLALGHQAAGIYQSRIRAAHWDGKNSVGESVASGIYFYTLSAGDFTATRKMLILK